MQDCVETDYSNIKLNLIELNSKDNVSTNAVSQSSFNFKKMNYFDDPIHLARIYIFIADLFFILSGILTKMYSTKFDYPLLHFCTITFMFLTIASYCYIVYINKYSSLLSNNLNKESTKSEIVSLLYIGSFRNWYFIRMISFTGCMLAGVYLFDKLKLSIAILMIQIAPLVSNILASLFLHDSLNKKYIFACVLCLIGICIMILLKEPTKTVDKEDNNLELEESKNMTVLSLFLAVINSIMLSFLNLTAKVLCKEIDPLSLNYLNGFWGSLFFAITCLFFSETKYLLAFLDVKLLGFCILNAISQLLGLTFVQMSLTLADISKVTYLFYLQVPIATLIGTIFFNESILLNEIVGGSLILGTILVTSINS